MIPSPAEPLGIAVLGCGWAATIHARALKHFRRDVRLYFASRDAAKAAEYARRHGGAGSFGSYEAALADERVRAVVVATPPAMHLEMTLAALAVGKDAVVEKPPFLRAADFDAVRAAEAASGGRRVLVAENYFYKPVAVRLRQLVGDGALGSVRFVRVNAVKQQHTAGWREDAGLAGGGALFEAGIHWVNLMANIGLGPSSAVGFRAGGSGAGGGDAIERSVLMVMRYDEGAVGTLHYSWDVPSPLKGIRISHVYGTEGSVSFESNGLWMMVTGKRGPRLHFPGVRDLLGYRAMWRDFIRALRTGDGPLMTLDRARRDVELIEDAYRTMDAEPGVGPRAAEQRYLAAD